MIRTVFLVLAALCLAPAAASAQANLEVSFIAPSTVDLYETKRFKARVENTGNADARDVDIYVQLPETRSNPTYVYGILGDTHRRCSLNGTILECRFKKIAPGKSKNAWFELAIPPANTPLGVIVEARTTSPESTTLDNAVSATLGGQAIDTPISTSTATPVTVNWCVGQDLLGHYTCTLFPGSILDPASLVLEADGTITFNDPAAPPGYTGAWTQLLDDRLSFVYRDGQNQLVAAFNGYAVGGGCFEGTTVFPQSGTHYDAYYSVCID
jgi:hypothetical protein